VKKGLPQYGILDIVGDLSWAVRWLDINVDVLVVKNAPDRVERACLVLNIVHVLEAFRNRKDSHQLSSVLLVLKDERLTCLGVPNLHVTRTQQTTHYVLRVTLRKPLAHYHIRLDIIAFVDLLIDVHKVAA
jgi:hypothetical protein